MAHEKNDGFSWQSTLICLACVAGSVAVVFQPYSKDKEDGLSFPFDLVVTPSRDTVQTPVVRDSIVAPVPKPH